MLIWKCKRVELSCRFMTSAWRFSNGDSPMESHGQTRKSRSEFLNRKMLLLQRALQRVLPKSLKEELGFQRIQVGVQMRVQAKSSSSLLILTLNIKIIFKTFIIHRILFSEFGSAIFPRFTTPCSSERLQLEIFQDANLVEKLSLSLSLSQEKCVFSQTRSRHISSISFDPISIFEESSVGCEFSGLWIRWVVNAENLNALDRDKHGWQRPMQIGFSLVQVLDSKSRFAQKQEFANCKTLQIHSILVKRLLPICYCHRFDAELHQNSIQTSATQKFWMQAFKFEPNLMVKHRLFSAPYEETVGMVFRHCTLHSHNASNGALHSKKHSFIRIGSAKITRYKGE